MLKAALWDHDGRCRRSAGLWNDVLFSEGDEGIRTQDDMVQERDADEIAGFSQPAGDLDVFVAGGGIP